MLQRNQILERSQALIFPLCRASTNEADQLQLLQGEGTKNPHIG